MYWKSVGLFRIIVVSHHKYLRGSPFREVGLYLRYMGGRPRKRTRGHCHSQTVGCGGAHLSFATNSSDTGLNLRTDYSIGGRNLLPGLRWGPRSFNGSLGMDTEAGAGAVAGVGIGTPPPFGHLWNVGAEGGTCL